MSERENFCLVYNIKSGSNGNHRYSNNQARAERLAHELSPVYSVEVVSFEHMPDLSGFSGVITFGGDGTVQQVAKSVNIVVPVENRPAIGIAARSGTEDGLSHYAAYKGARFKTADLFDFNEVKRRAFQHYPAVLSRSEEVSMTTLAEGNFLLHWAATFAQMRETKRPSQARYRAFLQTMRDLRHEQLNCRLTVYDHNYGIAKFCAPRAVERDELLIGEVTGTNAERRLKGYTAAVCWKTGLPIPRWVFDFDVVQSLELNSCNVLFDGEIKTLDHSIPQIVKRSPTPITVFTLETGK